MSFSSKINVGPSRAPKSSFNDKIKLKDQPKRFYKKKWFIFTFATLFLLLVAGGIMAYKTGYVLNKISDSDSSVLKSLFNVLPVVGKNELETDEDGRLNVLLLGMRGENMPGGGSLADSIMVISFDTKQNKVAMISIPRDLYVKVPGTESRSKINAVHAYGEQKGKGNGIKDMEQIIGEVTGLKIHYGVTINFMGFKQLIDSVGGVEVTLSTPFYETHQFVEGKECGLEFSLPAGPNTLNGERALCYARARDNTSDFDRAKRQQIILLALYKKLATLGTLADFGKLNNVLNAIGDNVRTDMASYEMKTLYEKYVSKININDFVDGGGDKIYRRVLENSEEGLLTVPAESNGAGYILIPRAGQDNYSQIQQVCRDIFTLPAQSDIDPQKQYRKPLTQEVTAPDLKKSDKKKKKKDAEVKGSSTSKDTTTDSSTTSDKTTDKKK